MMSKAASVLQFVALAVATVGWCLPVVAGEIYVADGSTVCAYPTSGATAQNTLVSNLTNNVGNNPVGVAVSGNDLFVLSSGDLLGGGQFGAYNATTGATINASLPVDLSTALGIAASGGNLLVANTFGDKIGEYTTSGATVNASLVTGLKNPTVMAVSGNDLFVANAGTTGNGTEFTPRSGSIGEYNATTGAVIQKTLVTGLTSNGNNYPVGIAVSGGNLFVTNLNTVAEYNASTGARKFVPPPGSRSSVRHRSVPRKSVCGRRGSIHDRRVHYLGNCCEFLADYGLRFPERDRRGA